MQEKCTIRLGIHVLFDMFLAYVCTINIRKIC